MNSRTSLDNGRIGILRHSTRKVQKKPEKEFKIAPDQRHSHAELQVGAGAERGGIPVRAPLVAGVGRLAFRLRMAGVGVPWGPALALSYLDAPWQAVAMAASDA